VPDVDDRTAHERKALRYPSDLTDAEWALVAPLIPSARRGGRPRDGYDAGKKTTGRKRHIVVDTLGLLLHSIVCRCHL
jgi:hypothetical protein